MDRQNWTLVTIAAGKTPLQPVQLQKALFLISKNVAPKILGKKFYTFEPYDYGPFCKAIYDDASLLETNKLAEITQPLGSRFNVYSATPSGLDAAAAIRQALPKEVTEYVDRMVAFVQSVTFTQLVSAIYKTYPEMREKSVFRG